MRLGLGLKASDCKISFKKEAEPQSTTGASLVVYFSATGTTEKLAETIADMVGADLYEIVPEEPYTDEDLDYNDDNSRANKEMNDEAARPAIASETIENIDDYDTIFIGYPVLHQRRQRYSNV